MHGGRGGPRSAPTATVPPNGGASPGSRASDEPDKGPPGITIERLAAGGDGVGRLPDGRTLFVPRTAPGDVIEPVRLREHKRFARARIGKLLESSPLRVEPRCPHYMTDDCGGCQLQHLGPEAQREARRGFDAMNEALARRAALQDAVA